MTSSWPSSWGSSPQEPGVRPALGRHPVQRCTSGTKRLHHPEVGDIDLGFEVLHLPDTSGQRIITYTAEPGSAASTALRLLGTSTAPTTSNRVGVQG